MYLLATAADEDAHAFDGATKGLQGWVDCFEQARLVGVVTATGVDAPGAIEKRLHEVNRARLMGMRGLDGARPPANSRAA